MSLADAHLHLFRRGFPGIYGKSLLGPEVEAYESLRAAHAIEAASDYRVPHGQAVAIGCVAETRLAERLTGFPRAEADRIEALFRRFGLPVTRRRRRWRSTSSRAIFRQTCCTRGSR